MLTGVFHLHEQEARQVMTPFPAVVTVDTSEDVETALRRCVSLRPHATGGDRGREPRPRQGHRARQLARPAADGATGRRPRSSRSCATRRSSPRPSRSTTCSPTSSASAPRWPWSSTSTGARPGVVTVEDIVEEVVGEIEDETDPAGGAVRQLANGDWFVRGHVAVNDLMDYGVELPADSDAYNSVGGFVFAQLGPPAQARRHGARRRLLDPRRVRAREPRRGGPHPPAGPAGHARGQRGRAPALAARAVGGRTGLGAPVIYDPSRRLNPTGPLSGPAECFYGRRCGCEVRRTGSMRTRPQAGLKAS